MRHSALGVLAILALLLVPPASAEGDLVTFEQSIHAGDVAGDGRTAGVELFGIQGASGTLRFSSAVYERAWVNDTADVAGMQPAPPVDPGHDEDSLDEGGVRFKTNSDAARLNVIPQGTVGWHVEDIGGSILPLPPDRSQIRDRMPLDSSRGEASNPLGDSVVWQSSPAGTTTISGSFMVSLYGFDLVFDDGSTFWTGTRQTELAGPAGTADERMAWLYVEDAVLTLNVGEGSTQRTYVQDPVITTVGTTTLRGLPTETERVYKGSKVLSVTSGGALPEGSVSDAGTESTSSGSALTALAAPRDSPWLWGGVGAALVLAGVLFVAMASRNVPMLEWRAYHALDRHRPHVAAFWANIWTRKDPWDGHAWSARGEARMLMKHDGGAARDFTKAHNLLPVHERAINALHAARAHARQGQAVQAAHWMGIVASLDLSVLLTAREEPDFATVWSHESVQRTVRDLIGVGASVRS